MDPLLALVVIGMLVGALVGSVAGEQLKGRRTMGLCVGLVLGPVLGLLAILMMDDARRKCWACTSAIPQAAIRCPRCGTDLQSQPAIPVARRVG